jgi:hypothetical protein
MSKMFIRVKEDGFIYPYNAIMAKNPACEVVPEEVAYPERFVPKTAAKRKSKLALETKDIPEEPDYTSSELAAEASRGLPE